MQDYHDNLRAVGMLDTIIADVPWGYEQKLTFQQDADRDAVQSADLAPYPKFDTLADYQEFFNAAHATLNHKGSLWVWSDWWNLHNRLPFVDLKIGRAREHFKFRGFCTVSRKPWAMGYMIRKNAYYIACYTKGPAFFRAKIGLPEYLGEFSRKECSRSHKPQAVYDRILNFCLPDGGAWCDPFPPTHVDAPMRTVARRAQAPHEALCPITHHDHGEVSRKHIWQPTTGKGLFTCYKCHALASCGECAPHLLGSILLPTCHGHARGIDEHIQLGSALATA